MVEGGRQDAKTFFQRYTIGQVVQYIKGEVALLVVTKGPQEKQSGGGISMMCDGFL
jgi:hypothetical protein